MQSALVLVYHWAIAGNELEIGRGPRTDKVYCEGIARATGVALGEEIEDAERDAAIVACQGMDHSTGYPARITFWHEVFPLANGNTQGAGNRFHQLYAVVAMGSQIDALAPRVLDHHHIRGAIVDTLDKVPLFFIHVFCLLFYTIMRLARCDKSLALFANHAQR